MDWAGVVRIGEALLLDAFNFQRLHWQAAELRVQVPAFFGRVTRGGRVAPRHGDVDILEDLARSDAEDAIGRLDQIVSFASAVLASEMIDEAEAGTELLGVD